MVKSLAKQTVKQEETEPLRKGARSSFYRFKEGPAGTALEPLQAAPARTLRRKLGAGPFELWPLDKNTLLKRWRSLGCQN